MDRRRLLVALGFGAANIAALSRLPGQEDAVELDILGAGQSPEDEAATTIDPSDTTATPRPTDPSTTTTEPEPSDGPPRTFDLAIINGRVIDPETGRDEMANVGITNGAIAAITTGPVTGAQIVDAGGRVVAPGFIDILSYEPNNYGIWYKVADGVTSNLAMHGVNSRARRFVDTYGGKSPCHFGGAFDHPFVRGILPGVGLELGVEDTASRSEITRMAELAEEDLSSGLVGINFGLEYTPGTSREEILALARVAESKSMPCFFHARHADPEPPGTNFEAVEEVINVAKETGAAVHISHLSSTGGTHTMARSLSQIEQARDQGYDVTACSYPYSFWATTLGSTRFSAGWQERFRISYSDLIVPGRPDIRINASNFSDQRADNLLVATADGTIPEDEIDLALGAPWLIVGSDAILEPANNNHPRSAGTFARLLGVYVRQRGVLGLTQALAKVTSLPAKLLEAGMPALAKKGRLQEGMDADITIFDPETIVDNAVRAQPNQESTGVQWVIVEGQIVRTPDGNVTSITNGNALTSRT